MNRKIITALFVAAAALGFAVKVAVAAVIVQAAVQVPGDPVSNLIVLAGGFATTALLGAVKRTDSRVTNSKAYRKAQPFLALAGTFALPLLAGKLGVQVDPQALINAPLATLVSIGAAEATTLFRRRSP